MDSVEMTQDQAVELAEKLVLLTTGTDKELAMELRNRLAFPIADILARVKGKTHKAKAARIGVSRNTYYEWKRNELRPTPAQARKLALATRISAEKIMGRKR
jgi:transcriptional regulator with XRE-family HTH domain